MGGDDVSRSKEEEELMLSSKAMLEGDRLGSLASRQSMRDQLRDSSDAPAERRPADFLPQLGGRGDDSDDGDRLSVRSEESEEEVCSGGAIRQVRGFSDVEHLSSASRKSAAPHIFNIYEQIFCDGTPSHQVPAVPESVRESMRASGRAHADLDYSLRPLSGRAELLLVLDAPWVAIEQAPGGVPGFGKQLVADLSVALGVGKDRLQVTGLHSEDGGRKAAAEVMVFSSHDGSPPSALEVAAGACAQASARDSLLKSMSSTRRTSVANFREVSGGGSVAGAPGARGLAGRSQGSQALTHGDTRPELSAIHPPSGTAARADAQREAREKAEGFWVDVEAGKGEKGKVYGTFGGVGGERRVPRWVWFVVTLCVLMVSVLIFQAVQRYVITLPRPPEEPSYAAPRNASPLQATAAFPLQASPKETSFGAPLHASPLQATAAAPLHAGAAGDPMNGSGQRAAAVSPLQARAVPLEATAAGNSDHLLQATASEFPAESPTRASPLQAAAAPLHAIIEDAAPLSRADVVEGGVPLAAVVDGRQ